jgi:hypothetical protein
MCEVHVGKMDNGGGGWPLNLIMLEGGRKTGRNIFREAYKF